MAPTRINWNREMEGMINRELIRGLRKKRAWTQDQLASISGLSHRTIQRVENKGVCSLESKKSLAAAFDINVSDLEPCITNTAMYTSTKQGRIFGFGGAFLGFAFSYVGITNALASGQLTNADAGLYYGGIGLFCGTCCAFIGWFTSKYQADTT